MIRIEHKDSKLGVFNARENRKDIIDSHSQRNIILNRHCNDNLFPGYRSDDVLNTLLSRSEIVDYRFAFKSMDQFYTAFTAKEVKEFITLGFEVYYIEATNTVESPYQIVFKPENITLKQNITQLFV